MEKVFETGEEITAYITGRVKGGFIATCDGFQLLCLLHKLM